MAWDGNGNYVLSPTYYPEVNGTVIDAVRYNGLMTDLKTALNNVVAKDGQVALTGNLPAGGFKITNLAVGSVAGDSTRFEQVWRNGAATIASAGTTELGSSAAGVITVSGTTTITSFGSTAETGQMKAVVFSGILTLTHNATSLILPTAANITTAAGDSAVFVHLGSGNWKCLVFQRANDSPMGPVSLPDGTGSAPGLSFTNDTNTGLYRIGTDCIGIAAGGNVVLGLGSGKNDIASYPGGAITLSSTVGAINTSGPNVSITAADVVLASSSGNGGSISLTAGRSSTAGTGGSITLSAGDNTGGDAGSVVFNPGTGNSATEAGLIRLNDDAGNTVLGVNGNTGHLFVDNAAGVPSLSGAGTSPSISGSDTAFKITLGTTPTATITATFAVAFVAAPVVHAQYQSANIACRALATTSEVVITMASAGSAGGILDVICIGTLEG